MKDLILDLLEKHSKQWQKNEQLKAQTKKAYKNKLYPTHEDIYGESEAKKGE